MEIILFVRPNCIKCMEVEERLIEEYGLDGFHTIDVTATSSTVLDEYALNWQTVPIVIRGDIEKPRTYRVLSAGPAEGGVRIGTGCGGCGNKLNTRS